MNDGSFTFYSLFWLRARRIVKIDGEYSGRESLAVLEDVRAERRLPCSARVNDCADVLAIERRRDALGVAAIDELNPAQQSRVVEQVEHNAIKGQGFKAALADFTAADL